MEEASDGHRFFYAHPISTSGLSASLKFVICTIAGALVGVVAYMLIW